MTRFARLCVALHTALDTVPLALLCSPCLLFHPTPHQVVANRAAGHHGIKRAADPLCHFRSVERHSIGIRLGRCRHKWRQRQWSRTLMAASLQHIAPGP